MNNSHKPVNAGPLKMSPQLKAKMDMAQQQSGNAVIPNPESVFVVGDQGIPYTNPFNGGKPLESIQALPKAQIQPAFQEFTQEPVEIPQQVTQVQQIPENSQHLPFSEIDEDLVVYMEEVSQRLGLSMVTPETCMIENLTRIIIAMDNENFNQTEIIKTLDENINQLNRKIDQLSQNLGIIYQALMQYQAEPARPKSNSFTEHYPTNAATQDQDQSQQSFESERSIVRQGSSSLKKKRSNGSKRKRRRNNN